MSNKVKHDLENELLRLKSIISFVYNDKSPFEKEELLSDANETLDNIKNILKKIE